MLSHYFYLSENLFNRSWNNSYVDFVVELVAAIVTPHSVLMTIGVIVPVRTEHSECFSWTCLAVGDNSRVKPVGYILNSVYIFRKEAITLNEIVDIALLRTLSEDSVVLRFDQVLAINYFYLQL